MINYRFDWSVLLQANYLSVLAGGLLVTVSLALSSGVLAIGVGLGVALARYSAGRWRRRLSIVFVDVFRNTPALILVFVFSFALPLLLAPEPRRAWLFDNALIDGIFDATGVHLYYFAALVAALTLNTAGYLVEIFRAGFEHIPAEQIDAARASGLSHARIVWAIVLPQGLRLSAMPATTRLIHNLKNTALAIFVPVPDFFSAVQSVISRSFRGLEFVLFGSAVYLALAVATSVAAARLTRSRLYDAT